MKEWPGKTNTWIVLNLKNLYKHPPPKKKQKTQPDIILVVEG